MISRSSVITLVLQNPLMRLSVTPSSEAGDDPPILTIASDLGLQERPAEGNWNGEIRPTKIAHHGKVNPDNPALTVEKGPAGAPDVVWAS